jgi:hypothetical protein
MVGLHRIASPSTGPAPAAAGRHQVTSTGSGTDTGSASHRIALTLYFVNTGFCRKIVICRQLTNR